MISCEEKNDSLNIYIVSDSLKSLDSKLIIRLIDFQGNELFKWNKNLLVEANSSTRIFKISKNDILNISLSLFQKYYNLKGIRHFFCYTSLYRTFMRISLATLLGNILKLPLDDNCRFLTS